MLQNNIAGHEVFTTEKFGTFSVSKETAERLKPIIASIITDFQGSGSHWYHRGAYHYVDEEQDDRIIWYIGNEIARTLGKTSVVAEAKKQSWGVWLTGGKANLMRRLGSTFEQKMAKVGW